MNTVKDGPERELGAEYQEKSRQQGDYNPLDDENKVDDAPPLAAEPESDAVRFATLFRGLDRAYGTYGATTTNERGKVEIKGSVRTVRRQVDLRLYEAHLAGEQRLGIVSVRDDGTVLFAAIDIDQYDLDHAALVEELQRRGLPLVPCRSKSGGVHLYAFFSEPIPAANARAALREIAIDLGYPQAEVFPKQDTLASPEGVGSWINLPYFSAEHTEQAALRTKGLAMTLCEFLRAAEAQRTSAADLSAKVASKTSARGGSKGGHRASRLETPASLCARLHEAVEELKSCEPGTRDDTLNRVVNVLGMATRGLQFDVAKIEEALWGAWRGLGKSRDDFEVVWPHAFQEGLDSQEPLRAANPAFDLDGKGRPSSGSQNNVRQAFELLGIGLRHDTFHDRLLIVRDGQTKLLDDPSLERLWLEIDEAFGFRPTKDFFRTVVSDTARQNAFHPVRDYLDPLVWDGVPRLDGWLSTYGGAEATPYSRAVGALVLLAAVRRARQPGVKFDEMLVLESPQGTNKSTALAVLGVEDDWFSDSLPLNANEQKVIESLSGRWIVEAGELNGIRKGEIDTLKAMLSRRVDRGRLAYERLVSEKPRQCVIVGTTNSAAYLLDSTGNRRFWPVKVSQFDVENLRADRDQLWAEAAHREAQGESIRLDPALWPDAAEQQSQREVEDPYFVRLSSKLGDLEGWIATDDGLNLLEIPMGQRSPAHNNRFADAMRKLSFQKKQRRVGERKNPVRGWWRGTDARRLIVTSYMGGSPEVSVEDPVKPGPQPGEVEDDVPF